jgi:hypothetical protein
MTRNPVTYILAGQIAVPCPDLLKWAGWYETADRIVGRTTIGDWWISTVFLGVDHNFAGRGAPLLYETMVFYTPAAIHERITPETSFKERLRLMEAAESLLSERDRQLIHHTERWHDWHEAERGHESVVVMIETHAGLSRRPADSTAPTLPDAPEPPPPGEP